MYQYSIKPLRQSISFGLNTTYITGGEIELFTEIPTCCMTTPFISPLSCNGL